MTIIQRESAHTIKGVVGRMFNAIKMHESKPRWTDDTFANQTWKASKEYMEGNRRYRIMVTIRFDDECHNGHNSFSVTGDIDLWVGRGWREYSGGCIHDDITKHFPGIAYLIRWHLTDADGPMHYIANTVYHASEGKFEYARACAVWPEATDKQLSAPKAKLTAALKRRLPRLLKEFRADIEGAGFLWSAADTGGK